MGAREEMSDSVIMKNTSAAMGAWMSYCIKQALRTYSFWPRDQLPGLLSLFPCWMPYSVAFLTPEDAVRVS